MVKKNSGATRLEIVNKVFVPNERKRELRARLKRISGQVEGLSRMLDENRPCMDVLTQVAAVQQALKGVSRLMTRNYLEQCAASAIKAGREREVYDELMDVIFKLAR